MNDAKYETLIALEYTGSINEMERDFYLDNGATSRNLNTAMREYLLAEGATNADINTMWYEFLRSEGFSGSLNEMQRDFWISLYPE